jgi:hypothetical protein
LNAANITSPATIIPNEINRTQLCIILLPAGLAGSPGAPLLHQYSLLDAAKKTYASQLHIISETGPFAWHPLL